MSATTIATWGFVFVALTIGCERKASSGPSDDSQGGKDAPRVVRVGYQKTGSLYVLRGRGTLEKRLATLGAEAEWIDFPSGPDLYEAMRGSSVDLGYVGETPPVFAVAGGVPFIYVAYEPPSPRAEAILVPKGSPARSLRDLRGKRIALNRGSNVHLLLLRALAEEQMQPDDVRWVYLPPADGRTAFEAGHVDAWIVWDPFYAAAEMSGARRLRDAVGLANNRAYYVARRRFATDHPDLLEATLAELESAAAWAKTHPEETARQYAQSTGLPLEVMIEAERRHDYGTQPMTGLILSEQQEIADLFSKLELVPRRVDMRVALPSPVVTWNAQRAR